MSTPARPGARLQQARIKAGYPSAREACTAFGWSLSSYSQHESDNRGLKKAAAAYAAAFRVSAEWLLYGDTPPPVSGRLVARQAGAVAGALPADVSVGAAWITPYGDAAGSAVPFAPAMLVQMAVDPSRCHVLQLTADHAAGPDLDVGDWIMFDTADTDTRRAGRFVVRAGDGLAVLQLQLMIGTDPARVHVSVAGPNPHQYDVPLEGLPVVGRVRWVGKSVR